MVIIFQTALGGSAVSAAMCTLNEWESECKELLSTPSHRGSGGITIMAASSQSSNHIIKPNSNSNFFCKEKVAEYYLFDSC